MPHKTYFVTFKTTIETCCKISKEKIEEIATQRVKEGTASITIKDNTYRLEEVEEYRNSLPLLSPENN